MQSWSGARSCLQARQPRSNSKLDLKLAEVPTASQSNSPEAEPLSLSSLKICLRPRFCWPFGAPRKFAASANSKPRYWASTAKIKALQKMRKPRCGKLGGVSTASPGTARIHTLPNIPNITRSTRWRSMEMQGVRDPGLKEL